VLTLTAGTMLVVWIADQITERGIGNGIALIFAVGFAVELPSAIASAFVGVNHGSVSPNMIAIAAVLAAAIIALIVLVEGARRQISVDYAKREIGGRSIEAVSAPLALKVNNAGGIMPAFLANWIILLPSAVATYAFGADSALGSFILNHLRHGRPVFTILFWAMIVAFMLFYTAFLLDPEKVSQKLKAHGGTIRGIEPGEPTAAYFDDVVSRISIFAGFYLAFVFIIPELLAVYFHVPFYLGGQAFLIVVCAVLDIGAYRQQMQLQPGGARP
jgi:preprotein translocase subunit SecY